MHHNSATTAFYWIQLKDIPCFIFSYTTTFTVLASSNLIITRKNQPGHHILAPATINSIALFLIPAVWLTCFVTSSRAGGAWGHVYSVWEDLHAHIEEQGAAFEDVLTPEQVTDQVAALRRLASRTLGAAYVQFVHFEKVSYICGLVCITTLFAVRTLSLPSYKALNHHFANRSTPLEGFPSSGQPRSRTSDH